MEPALKVLVVDDSVVYRKVLSELLAAMPGVEVVGTAPNGKIALEKIASLRPELVTLDLAMPEVDGLELLRRLGSMDERPGVLVLSAASASGAAETMAALEAGAFDFVLKPDGRTMAENSVRLAAELTPKVAAFARRHSVERLLRGVGHGSDGRRAALPAASANRCSAAAADCGTAARETRAAEAVVVGISTGGPKALAEMLPRLPARLGVPVLIVQHMPAFFTGPLAEDLNRRSRLRVSEAADGDAVLPDHVYIAPGGRQMGLAREASGVAVRITDDPPENSCRPAVDYLFRDAARIYGAAAVGVVMTGMGSDGTAGCEALKRVGARVVVQDEASCVVFGMPREPIERGLVDVVAPLDRMADEIVRMVGKVQAGCK